LLRLLKYCFSFYGRFNRTDFWIGYGIAFVAIMVAVALVAMYPDTTAATLSGVWCLFWLASICAVATKRLHDLDHSGLALLAFFAAMVAISFAMRPQDRAYESLLPGIGLLYLGCTRGAKGANRFGPQPYTADPSSKQDPKLTRAYEMGRQSVESFAADLEKLMNVRFKPVSDGYLGVIQGQYNKCLTPTDAPPIIAARIEYKVFLDNVDELRGKMMDQITATLSGWLDLADQMQTRDKFTELIQANVDMFCRELSESGLQRLLDMAHALKLADDQWRVAHPELTPKFPPDT
jgi:uncharacterized membrane protein YhaH (DUF805 family)